MADFDGLAVDMGNLHRLSSARTRSICPENPTGEKGRGGMAIEGTGASAARDLGRGWKVNPWIPLQPGETATLADVDGPGAIQHIWMTVTPPWRRSPSGTRRSPRRPFRSFPITTRAR